MCHPQPNPKETTEKYGLEAGLWQVFTNKDPETGKSKGQQAKDLLKRYGSAYLITSISFAIVSFAACYALVSAGELSLAPLPTIITLTLPVDVRTGHSAFGGSKERRVPAHLELT